MCCRMVKCTFGILPNKWHILHTAFQITPANATNIIKTTSALNNYVRERDGYIVKDCLPHTLELAQWSTVWGNVNALTIFNSMAQYCMSLANEDWWQERLA